MQSKETAGAELTGRIDIVRPVSLSKYRRGRPPPPRYLCTPKCCHRVSLYPIAGAFRTESSSSPFDRVCDAVRNLLLFARMGIGHRRTQLAFEKTNWQHRFQHGGVLRNSRLGRGARPLSSKDSVHVVFKIHRQKLNSKSLRTPRNYLLVSRIIEKFATRFCLKVSISSIQGDHLHILVKARKRSRYLDFLRVVPGQIAQRLSIEGALSSSPAPKPVTDTPQLTANHSQKGTGLWKHRPFTRIVRSYRDQTGVRNYIQLNEKEARGEIPYRNLRLKGMSSQDWRILWT